MDPSDVAAVQQHLKTLEIALASIADERDSLLRQRRDLLATWRSQAEAELNLLRDLRRFKQILGRSAERED
jgi:hypothetical protein